MHVQKGGVCIGACMACTLSDISLAHCGRQVDKAPHECPSLGVHRVFGFVDNFQVVMVSPSPHEEVSSAHEGERIFQLCFPVLRSSMQLMVNYSY